MRDLNPYQTETDGLLTATKKINITNWVHLLYYTARGSKLLVVNEVSLACLLTKSRLLRISSKGKKGRYRVIGWSKCSETGVEFVRWPYQTSGGLTHYPAKLLASVSLTDTVTKWTVQAHGKRDQWNWLIGQDYSKTRLTAEVDCRVHHCAIADQKHTSCPCLWYTFPRKERFYF